MKRQCLEIGGKLFEAKKDESGKLKFPVIIISQGLGNLVDRNYYTADAIKSAPQVYEGKKAYFDHPTQDQMEQQPGRSVRETAGHYEDCQAIQDQDGLWVLKAFFVPEKENSEVIGKINHAIEYKKKYPNKDYIGISINGDGEGKTLDYTEFVKEYQPKSIEMQKIAQIEGQSINAITKLTDAVSADLVTEPGAKGRVLLESQKNNQKGNKMKFLEAFKKLFLGIESNDKSLTEAAVNSMLQAEKKEGDDEDEEKKKKEAAEAAAKAEEAEAHEAAETAKALLACKKESKKEENESEEEYEARCMKQAVKKMKQAKKEAAEAAKKAEDEAKKKEDEEKKKQEAGKKKEGDDDKHDDAAQDKALFKKLMKDHEELKKEAEGLKKENEELKKENKKEAAESAKSKIALETKKRDEFIDKVLAESGMKRNITKHVRPVLEKCKTEEEIKATAKELLESYSKVIEAEFYNHASRGFTEISTTDNSGSTDHLFQ